MLPLALSGASTRGGSKEALLSTHAFTMLLGCISLVIH